MKCAYCGQEAKGTKEHIISAAILDLFPECFITFDEVRNVVHDADPMVKDVCGVCNNQRLSYIDSYAKDFVGRYFINKYDIDDSVEIEYDYSKLQKMLLKFAYNDMRSHKDDISYFDNEIIHYLLNEADNTPKEYITVMGGLAVNVSPLPDAMFGNLKLRWCKNPIFYNNSTIRFINYDTGEIILNNEVGKENFPDLKLAYVFRFNSVELILICWDKNSKNIEMNNVVLSCQYPHTLFKSDTLVATLKVCTDELNYHHFGQVHVKWEGLFEVGRMRKLAMGEYKFKDKIDQLWKLEEKRLKKEHSR